MFCSNCGKQLSDGALQCPDCGEPTSTGSQRKDQPFEYRDERVD